MSDPVITSSVRARCSSGHEWNSVSTVTWAVIPPRRVKTRAVVLDAPSCPQCGRGHVSFTETRHLSAAAAAPAPAALVIPAFSIVRARCRTGHEWETTEERGVLAEPYCPNCDCHWTSFKNSRHG
jgi:hypothetical protein